MFQKTAYEKKQNGKKIIDSNCAIKIKDIIYPTLLKLSKSKVKFKIVKENKMKYFKDKPIIFVANHTRFQDTPIVCKIINEEIKERGYIFAGKQKLSFLDNVFFELYGSIFLDRKNKDDMKVAQTALEEYLSIGKPVIIFPEATWNMTDELLMMPMKWGIINSAKKENAQIIPLVLEYDDEEKKCTVVFDEPILIDLNSDLKTEIDNLRDKMATQIFELISKKEVKRKDIDISEEKAKIHSVVEEYPNYDYEYEQSCVYKPYADAEEVFAPIKKLVPNKNNAFLFNKRNIG